SGVACGARSSISDSLLKAGLALQSVALQLGPDDVSDVTVRGSKLVAAATGAIVGPTCCAPWGNRPSAVAVTGACRSGAPPLIANSVLYPDGHAHDSEMIRVDSCGVTLRDSEVRGTAVGQSPVGVICGRGTTCVLEGNDIAAQVDLY